MPVRSLASAAPPSGRACRAVRALCQKMTSRPRGRGEHELRAVLPPTVEHEVDGRAATDAGPNRARARRSRARRATPSAGWQYTLAVRGHVSRTLSTRPSRPSGSRRRYGRVELRIGVAGDDELESSWRGSGDGDPSDPSEVTHPSGRTVHRPCRTSSPSTPAPPACGPSPSATTARRSATPTASSPQHFPQPGWVEHDAEEIWDDDRGRVRRGRRRPTARRRRIGITNQRETVVAWSRSTGRPLARAIVWQDRRTADRCDALADGRAPRHSCAAAPGSCSTRTSRARRSPGCSTEGGVRGRATTSPSAPSTRGWCGKLTGGAVHATEPSNASRTMLYDIVERRWSDGAVRAARRPARRPCPRCGRRSATSATTADGVPITGILGDQQAALFGQACLEPGMAKNTYGTGSFVLANVGDRRAPSRSRACSRRWPGTSARTAGSPTPSRAPSSSPAPRCSGCATASA